MPQQPTPNWMKPLWVRLLFVILPAIWAGVEALYGQQMWALLFGAVAAWGAWTLLIKHEDGAPKP
jgi:hypothetical protein